MCFSTKKFKTNMKIKYLLLVLLISNFSCVDQRKEHIENLILTNEMVRAHLINREDSTKWDLEMLRSDLGNKINDSGLPFTSGVFPVPAYDLLAKESFKGVGNFGFPGGEEAELRIDDKTILFNSFFVGANVFNQNHVEDDRKNESFFHIIVLTNYVDTVSYAHLSSEIVSRNHPDYIGQGFYKTKESKVDYSAFITGDRNAYAIINMRLFDLKNGKTILIAPRKDGSLRSMQVKSPQLSSEQIEGYTIRLLENEKVKAFFTASGNI